MSGVNTEAFSGFKEHATKTCLSDEVMVTLECSDDAWIHGNVANI
jgi:hypothetical protein